jgi:hypothetical protein
MSLTDAQYTTLANHIRANIEPEVVAALAIRNDTELAKLYNLDTDFYVWKTSITPDEYTLNAGNARIWEWVTNYFTGNLDASDANVRQGIADAFGAGTTTRANLLALGKRLASLYEEVFATGTGTEATPGTMVLQGPVTTKIMGKALNEY